MHGSPWPLRNQKVNGASALTCIARPCCHTVYPYSATPFSQQLSRPLSAPARCVSLLAARAVYTPEAGAGWVGAGGKEMGLQVWKGRTVPHRDVRDSSRRALSRGVVRPGPSRTSDEGPGCCRLLCRGVPAQRNVFLHTQWWVMGTVCDVCNCSLGRALSRVMATCVEERQYMHCGKFSVFFFSSFVGMRASGRSRVMRFFYSGTCTDFCFVFCDYSTFVMQPLQ